VSKHNNVNPDHYKVGGRERPGNAAAKAPKAIAHEEKMRARTIERVRRKSARTGKQTARTGIQK